MAKKPGHSKRTVPKIPKKTVASPKARVEGRKGRAKPPEKPAGDFIAGESKTPLQILLALGREEKISHSLFGSGSLDQKINELASFYTKISARTPGLKTALPFETVKEDLIKRLLRQKAKSNKKKA